MHERHESRIGTVTLLVLAYTAAVLLALYGLGCASGGPRPTPAPQPPPAAEMILTARVSAQADDAPIHHVAIHCDQPRGAWDGESDGFGRAFIPAVMGQQIDCRFELAGWGTVSQSALPGPDTELVIRLVREVVVAPVARVGRLRLTGQGYADDTGPVLPLYEHHGNGLSWFARDPVAALAQLDEVAKGGYQGVRVWLQLGCGRDTTAEGCPPGAYWRRWVNGPDVTAGYWDTLRQYGQALRARGLRAVASQGDINQLRNRCDFMQRVAALDNELGGFIDFIDGANEGSQTGESDPAALARFVDCYRTAGGTAIRSLTSGDGEDKGHVDPYLIFPAQVWDIHPYRAGHWFDKIRHIFSAGYEGGFALPTGMFSEPAGNGPLVTAIDNREELDDEAVPLMAVAAYIGRAAFVHFSGEGVIVDKGLQTDPGFYTTPKAVAWLPRDLMAFPYAWHSGDRWRGLRIVAAQNEGRVDCRGGGVDGRFACVIYGPSGSYRFPVERAFAGRLCDPGTGACEDVSLRPGQSLAVNFRRGRVLVGAVQ